MPHARLHTATTACPTLQTYSQGSKPLSGLPQSDIYQIFQASFPILPAVFPTTSGVCLTRILRSHLSICPRRQREVYCTMNDIPLHQGSLNSLNAGKATDICIKRTARKKGDMLKPMCLGVMHACTICIALASHQECER